MYRHISHSVHAGKGRIGWSGAEKGEQCFQTWTPDRCADQKKEAGNLSFLSAHFLEMREAAAVRIQKQSETSIWQIVSSPWFSQTHDFRCQRPEAPRLRT